MEFHLEDLSDMIAGLLTIYENGIYMPYMKIFDGKTAILIANKDNMDDAFLMYQNGTNPNDIVFIGLEYSYIKEFMRYLNSNEHKNMTMSDIICDFLNKNYDKTKRKVK